MPAGLDHDVAALVPGRLAASRRRRSARARAPVLAPAKARSVARAGADAELHEQQAQEARSDDRDACHRRGSRCAAKTFIAQPSGSPGNGSPSSSGGSAIADARVDRRRTSASACS